MKLFNIIVYSAALLLISVIGCTKPPVGNKGEKGLPGQDGGKGAPGDAGDKGQNGQPLVYASAWKSLDSSSWQEQLRYTYYTNHRDTNGNSRQGFDTTIDYSATMSFAQITQGALDTSAILLYVKDSAAALSGQPVLIHYAFGAELFFGTANRPFAYYLVFGDTQFDPAGKLVFYTTWRGSFAFYDPQMADFNPNAIRYTELTPKTKAYVRCVIIPGGQKTGREAVRNKFRDYETLKAYYHLKD